MQKVLYNFYSGTDTATIMYFYDIETAYMLSHVFILLIPAKRK